MSRYDPGEKSIGGCVAVEKKPEGKSCEECRGCVCDCVDDVFVYRSVYGCQRYAIHLSAADLPSSGRELSWGL